MSTPAEILLSRSTLQSGTPWEHLNNLFAGTGGGLTLIDSFELELMAAEIDIDIDLEVLDIELLDDSVQIDVTEIELEVDIND